MIRIVAHPRIHLTLIGMHNTGYRVNGGIGFAIGDPAVTITIEPSNRLHIRDSRDIALSDDQFNRLKGCLIDLVRDKKLNGDFLLSISGRLPTSSGFGSGTIIRLACVELILLINNISYTEEDVVAYSKRGGTSGVGIRTYFQGGYSFDIGRKYRSEIVPSSIAESGVVQSMLVESGQMPAWEFGLCIPRNDIIKMYDEKEFFDKTTPINSTSVHEILYHVVYGIYGAVKEHDKGTFCKAVKAIQHTEWKGAEWQLNGEVLKSVSNRIYELGAECVGLSSLGPMLFYMSSNLDYITDDLNNEFGENFEALKTTAVNHGRTIEYV